MEDKYIFDKHSAILTAIHEGRESEVDAILNKIYQNGFEDGCNSNKEGTVVIEVEGGVVTDVKGLPDNWDYSLEDFDI